MKFIYDYFYLDNQRLFPPVCQKTRHLLKNLKIRQFNLILKKLTSNTYVKNLFIRIDQHGGSPAHILWPPSL